MRKPVVVIVNSNYPKEDNRYGDVFVHSRLKFYKEHFTVKVVGWKKRIADYSYEYEGIPVDVVNTQTKLIAKINSYKPDAIGFHFIEGWMDKKIVRKFNVPVLIWVHGGEALGWYRRLFQFSLSTLFIFARYVGRNIIQMTQMRHLIHYVNSSSRIKMIFVSRWMKSITEKDTLTKIQSPLFIPNPIDPLLFKYQEKSADHRKHILLIRSFDSKKYANDLAIEAILKLSNKEFFKDLTFNIYGVGKYFKPLTDQVKAFPNVTLHNYFLENKDIPQVHKLNGIFLCPTRQDAQGVSMCEAMSSGLIPITSFNTAIPEFIKHEDSGFMTTSADQIAHYIEYLYKSPDKYLEISKKASGHIQAISGTPYVVNREMDLIRELLLASSSRNL